MSRSVADRLETIITGLVNNGRFKYKVKGLLRDRVYATPVPNVDQAWLINKLREIERQAREEQEK